MELDAFRHFGKFEIHSPNAQRPVRPFDSLTGGGSDMLIQISNSKILLYHAIKSSGLSEKTFSLLIFHSISTVKVELFEGSLVNMHRVHFTVTLVSGHATCGYYSKNE